MNRTIKDRASFYILFLGISVGLSFVLYKKYPALVNSNAFVSFSTLLVGGFAIFLYLKQRKDQKRDTARIILQEIRRAESIIADYKEFGTFKFTRKLIATNSWDSNLHYFADDLEPDEIDKISDLYSTGEYLDKIIMMVSDVKFDERVKKTIVEQAKEQVNAQLEQHASKIQRIVSSVPALQDNGSTTAVPIPPSTFFSQNPPMPLKEEFNFSVNVNLEYNSVTTDALFREVVSKYEPIYHSKIVQKIERIANPALF